MNKEVYLVERETSPHNAWRGVRNPLVPRYSQTVTEAGAGTLVPQSKPAILHLQASQVTIVQQVEPVLRSG